LQGGSAGSLATTGAPVNVGNADPPNPGDVLTAIDPTHAAWAAPTGGGTPDNALLRSANDWAEFPNQEGPSSSDLFLIERASDGAKQTISAGSLVGRAAKELDTLPGDPVNVGDAAPPVAGQVLTAIDATHAHWAAAASGGGGTGGHPIISPPLVPNAFDDEFDSGGNPDLAARGWLIFNNGSGATLTRAGDVEPFSVPAAGTYRSTIIGSRIYIQTPTSPSGDIQMTRAITLANGDLYYARMSNSARGDLGAADHSFMGLYLSIAAGPLPDLGNGLFARTYITSANRAAQFGRINGGAPAANFDTFFGESAPDMFGVKFHSGANFYPFLGDADSGSHIGGNYGGAVDGESIAFVSLLLST